MQCYNLIGVHYCTFKYDELGFVLSGGGFCNFGSWSCTLTSCTSSEKHGLSSGMKNQHFLMMLYLRMHLKYWNTYICIQYVHVCIYMQNYITHITVIFTYQTWYIFKCWAIVTFHWIWHYRVTSITYIVMVIEILNIFILTL